MYEFLTEINKKDIHQQIHETRSHPWLQRQYCGCTHHGNTANGIYTENTQMS